MSRKPIGLPFDRPLDRKAYFLWGIALFAVKHNLDRFLAGKAVWENWSVWDYIRPIPTPPLGEPALRFYGLLLLISLPFIAAGVLLTLRRLRDAGLPRALVALVFIPFVKLAFFAYLCLVPSRMDRVRSVRWPTRRNPWLPTSALGSATLAVLLSAAAVLVLAAFATLVLGSYGWGLFVGLPFLAGLSSVLIASQSRPLRTGEALGIANLTVVVCGALMLVVAVEGAICLLMAAPLAFPLASLGGYVGYRIQSGPGESLRAGGIAGLFLVAPLAMTLERPSEIPTYAVTTAIDVKAPPEFVWDRVVEFSELPPPRELLFRAGIAYPMRARIVGRGRGAIRYCEFSTGPFVEPIEVWDAPKLLRFAVTKNPAPLEEWTPYRHIDPPHLHGFLVSKQGQFRLIRREDGGTTLEGTTWYQHSLWPATYWRLWSDEIIHRIHRRVLEHIREESEAARPARS